MIVIWESHPINKASAKLLAEAAKPNEVTCRYPDINFESCSDKTLTILDLQANSNFQNTMMDEQVANDLINEWHMPESIKTINLLVSHVPTDDEDEGIDIFASDLAQTLKDKYQREIEVRVINDFESTYTLLVPPQHSTSGKEWEVFGLNSEDIPRKKPAFVFNFDNLLQLVKTKNIKPTWQGKNLEAWLSRAEQKYTAWSSPASRP